MLTNLETNVIAIAIIIATVGIAYFIDSSLTDTPTISLELDSSTDILHPSDAVPQISEELVSQSEPPIHSDGNCETLSTPGSQCNAYDYRHEYWPSPRPVNFVKALIKSGHSVEYEGRLTHAKAVDILASIAEMDIHEFLKTDPITYTKIFMPEQYTASILLGRSIKSLEETISRHKYLDTLRRHG